MIVFKFKHIFLFKAISIFVVIAFTLTSVPCIEEAHALSPWAGTQRSEIILGMLDKAYLDGKIDFAKHGDPVLGEEEAVLLSHGKILLSSELAGSGEGVKLKRLRLIFREEVRAVMQILAENERSKYSRIMNYCLSHKGIMDSYNELLKSKNTPTVNPEEIASSEEFERLTNDMLARGFELWLLNKDGVVGKRHLTKEEWLFLEEIRKYIENNLHNYFTGIFRDQGVREMNIRIALANGQKFRTSPQKVEAKGEREETPSEDYSEDEFADYLRKRGLHYYHKLRDSYTPDVIRALLDDPALRPVFMQVLPEEHLGPLKVVGGEKTAGVDTQELLCSYSVFNAGDAMTAERLLRNGKKIVIGVTDQRSDKTLESISMVANGRTVYFPLPDGTWLAVKGSGQNNEPHKRPFYLRNDVGLVMRYEGLAWQEEAVAAEEAQELTSGNGGRFVELLGYRRIFAAPNGKGELITTEGAIEKDNYSPSEVPVGTNPVLIFNRAITPHRLTKIGQLLEEDRSLRSLTSRISGALRSIGRLPEGKELTPNELIDMMFDQFGKGEAVKQNLGLAKETLHSQDLTFAGEEADSEEFCTFSGLIKYMAKRKRTYYDTREFELIDRHDLNVHGVGGKVKALTDAYLVSLDYFGAGSENLLFPSPVKTLEKFFRSYFAHIDDDSLVVWVAIRHVDAGRVTFPVSVALGMPEIYLLHPRHSEDPNMTRFREHDREAAEEIELMVEQWAWEEAEKRGLISSSGSDKGEERKIDIKKAVPIVFIFLALTATLLGYGGAFAPLSGQYAASLTSFLPLVGMLLTGVVLSDDDFFEWLKKTDGELAEIMASILKETEEKRWNSRIWLERFVDNYNERGYLTKRERKISKQIIARYIGSSFARKGFRKTHIEFSEERRAKILLAVKAVRDVVKKHKGEASRGISQVHALLLLKILKVYGIETWVELACKGEHYAVKVSNEYIWIDPYPEMENPSRGENDSDFIITPGDERHHEFRRKYQLYKPHFIAPEESIQEAESIFEEHKKEIEGKLSPPADEKETGSSFTGNVFMIIGISVTALVLAYLVSSLYPHILGGIQWKLTTLKGIVSPAFHKMGAFSAASLLFVGFFHSQRSKPGLGFFYERVQLPLMKFFAGLRRVKDTSLDVPQEDRLLIDETVPLVDEMIRQYEEDGTELKIMQDFFRLPLGSFNNHVPPEEAEKHIRRFLKEKMNLTEYSLQSLKMGPFAHIYKCTYEEDGKRREMVVDLSATTKLIVRNVESDFDNLTTFHRKGLGKYVPEPYAGMEIKVDHYGKKKRAFVFAAEWVRGYEELHIARYVAGTRFLRWVFNPKKTEREIKALAEKSKLNIETQMRKQVAEYRPLSEKESLLVAKEIAKILAYYYDAEKEQALANVFINNGDFVYKRRSDGSVDVKLITARWRKSKVKPVEFLKYLASLVVFDEETPYLDGSFTFETCPQHRYGIRVFSSRTVLEGFREGLIERYGLEEGSSLFRKTIGEFKSVREEEKKAREKVRKVKWELAGSVWDKKVYPALQGEPLEHSIKYYDLVDPGEDVKEAISQAASWEKMATLRKGRSQILPLKGDVSVRLEVKGEAKTFTVRAIKIKAVGDFNDPAKPKRPSQEVYENGKDYIEIHPAVSEGKIYFEKTPPGPTGGMLYKRAEAEGEKTIEALLSGQDVGIPIACGMYENLKFEGEKLGFLAMAVYDVKDRRAVDLFDDISIDDETGVVSGEYFKKLLEEIYGHVVDPMGLMVFIQMRFASLGRALRDFHDRGRVHRRPHTGNFAFSEQGVAIYDLASSATKKSMDPEDAFLYQLVGDLAVSLESMFDFLDQTELGRLLSILGFNPYYFYLKGYFYDIQAKQDHRILEVANMITESMHHPLILSLEDHKTRYFKTRFLVQIISAINLYGLMKKISKKTDIKPPSYGWRRFSRDMQRAVDELFGEEGRGKNASSGASLIVAVLLASSIGLALLSVFIGFYPEALNAFGHFDLNAFKDACTNIASFVFLGGMLGVLTQGGEEDERVKNIRRIQKDKLKGTPLIQVEEMEGCTSYEDIVKYTLRGEFLKKEHPLLEIMQEVIERSSRAVWVDVGPGYGLALRQGKKILGDGLVTYGVDPIDWLEEPHEKKEEEVQKYKALLGDDIFGEAFSFTRIPQLMEHASLPEEADIVTISRTLPYSSNPLKTIENFYNQLRAGGVLIVIGSFFMVFSDGKDIKRMMVDSLKSQGIDARLKSGASEVLYIRKPDSRKLYLNVKVVSYSEVGPGITMVRYDERYPGKELVDFSASQKEKKKGRKRASSKTREAIIKPLVETPIQTAPEVIEGLIQKYIALALGVLNEREKFVITKRLGLDGRGRNSLSKVGKLLDVRRERVRQVESKAYRRLKRWTPYSRRLKRLVEFLRSTASFTYSPALLLLEEEELTEEADPAVFSRVLKKPPRGKRLIGADEIIEKFRKHHVRWGSTTHPAKLKVLEVLASEVGKKPGELDQNDFYVKVAGLGNKSLSGLLGWAMKKYYCQAHQAVRKLKALIRVPGRTTPIGPRIVSNLLLTTNIKVDWHEVTPTAKRLLVRDLARYLGKNIRDLRPKDFCIKLPHLGSRTLSGLLYWADRKFRAHEKEDAFRKLMKHLFGFTPKKKRSPGKYHKTKTGFSLTEILILIVGVSLAVSVILVLSAVLNPQLLSGGIGMLTARGLFYASPILMVMAGTVVGGGESEKEPVKDINELKKGQLVRITRRATSTGKVIYDREMIVVSVSYKKGEVELRRADLHFSADRTHSYFGERGKDVVSDTIVILKEKAPNYAAKRSRTRPKKKWIDFLKILLLVSTIGLTGCVPNGQLSSIPWYGWAGFGVITLGVFSFFRNHFSSKVPEPYEITDDDVILDPDSGLKEIKKRLEEELEKPRSRPLTVLFAGKPATAKSSTIAILREWLESSPSEGGLGRKTALVDQKKTYPDTWMYTMSFSGICKNHSHVDVVFVEAVNWIPPGGEYIDIFVRTVMDEESRKAHIVSRARERYPRFTQIFKRFRRIRNDLRSIETPASRKPDITIDFSPPGRSAIKRKRRPEGVFSLPGGLVELAGSIRDLLKKKERVTVLITGKRGVGKTTISELLENGFMDLNEDDIVILHHDEIEKLKMKDIDPQTVFNMRVKERAQGKKLVIIEGIHAPPYVRRDPDIGNPDILVTVEADDDLRVSRHKIDRRYYTVKLMSIVGDFEEEPLPIEADKKIIIENNEDLKNIQKAVKNAVSGNGYSLLGMMAPVGILGFLGGPSPEVKFFLIVGIGVAAFGLFLKSLFVKAREISPYEYQKVTSRWKMYFKLTGFMTALTVAIGFLFPWEVSGTFLAAFIFCVPNFLIFCLSAELVNISWRFDVFVYFEAMFSRLKSVKTSLRKQKKEIEDITAEVRETLASLEATLKELQSVGKNPDRDYLREEMQNLNGWRIEVMDLINPPLESSFVKPEEGDPICRFFYNTDLKRRALSRIDELRFSLWSLGKAIESIKERYALREEEDVETSSDVSEEEKIEIEKEKLQEALKNSYRAVVVDVDGTLTNFVDGKIPEELIEKMAELVDRGVYVALASGRAGWAGNIECFYAADGENSEEKWQIDIESVAARIREKVTREERLRFLIVLEQNGARATNGFKVGDSRRVDYSLGFDPLDGRIIRKVYEGIQKEYGDKLFYFVNKGHCATIRIKPEYANKSAMSILTRKVKNILEAEGASVELLPADTGVIDIVSPGIKKSNIFDILSSRLFGIGIPESKIATIGDQGAPNANDHSILERFAGFCVGLYYSFGSLQTSMLIAKGLKSSDATRWLLDNLKFESNLPPEVRMLDEVVSKLRKRDSSFGNDLEYSAELMNTLMRCPIDNALIVGNSLIYISILLAAMGKTVTYVDAEKRNMSVMRTIIEGAESDLGRSLPIRVVEGEIGTLALEEKGIDPHSFDLVTFMDLAGGVQVGEPKKWLEKARELIRDEGYVVIDARREHYMSDTIREHLDEVFPVNRLLVHKAFRGTYGDMGYGENSSKNYLYYVRGEEEGTRESRGESPPKDALKAPLKIVEVVEGDDTLLDESLEEKLKDPAENIYASSLLENKIVVQRSSIPLQEAEEVLLDVVSVKDITRANAPAFIGALSRWFECEHSMLIHQADIKKLIETLEGVARGESVSFRNNTTNIYLAFSTPRVNGSSSLEVEGVVRFSSQLWEQDCVNWWQIHPGNRSVQLEKWRERGYSSRGEKPRDIERRFEGVGRQLLVHAVMRELDNLKNGLNFSLYASQVLNFEGLKPHTVYNRTALINYILGRSGKTLKKLNEAIQGGDEGARRIMDVLASEVQKPSSGAAENDSSDKDDASRGKGSSADAYQAGSAEEEASGDIQKLFADFREKMRLLEEKAYNDYTIRVSDVYQAAARLESEGQSLILYADDILESTAVSDLERTFRTITKDYNVLKGGKIIIYSRKEECGVILQELISSCAPDLEVVSITRSELEERMNITKGEEDEIKALARFARQEGEHEVVGMIRGPIEEPEKVSKLLARNNIDIPIVIVGMERGLYSFAEAVQKAISKKMAMGLGGWIVSLNPVRAWSEDIDQEYRAFKQSLATLKAA